MNYKQNAKSILDIAKTYRGKNDRKYIMCAIRGMWIDAFYAGKIAGIEDLSKRLQGGLK